MTTRRSRSRVRRLSGIEGRTERLHLRLLQEADAEAFTDACRVSEELWRPWSPAPEVELSDREVFFREWQRARQGAEAGTHLRLAAFDGDVLVALVSLNEIVRGAFESAYAGWRVRADRTRMGYGVEAVRGLLDAAFSPQPLGAGLHRVQANVMPSNEASLRLAERVGFRREGEARRYLKIAGRWEDHVMHAITVEEWRAGR